MYNNILNFTIILFQISLDNDIVRLGVFSFISHKNIPVEFSLIHVVYRYCIVLG